MFCPNYRNKEVFDGFNELIEAFGGEPMTEEEFRDSELRNQRTGSNYSAMEAAYRVYDQNGGNFLDKTPQGKQSILFQSLLDLFGGDRIKAIIAKSNIYSQNFFNWFGDWIDDPTNTSEIVDENGEPFIAYTGTTGDFTVFDSNFAKTASKGFFFTVDREVASSYGNVKPVFLNIRNLKETNSELSSLDTENGKFDGVQYIHYGAEAFVVWNPNQIKSVFNLGTFDPNNADINMMTSSLVSVELNQFNDASMTSTFGNNITNRLLNDEYVNSEEIINTLLQNNAVDADNVQLSRILARHNIPIRLDSSIGGLSLATTITDNNTGNSIVLLNPDLISQVTNRYLSTAVLHEIVHAVTVNAINNPTTKEQARFKELNSKVFNKFKNSFPQHSDLFNDVDSGYYALTNEKEFAAVFITDEHARYNFIQLARELDQKENGRFINLFRRFINSITQLFVNKDIFKSNESQVLEYQREFIKYLAGVPTMDQASKLSKEDLNSLYDRINIKSLMMESVIDKMKYLSNYSDAIERNDLVAISFRRPGSKQQDVIENKYSFEDIENKLQLRINAIRTSDLKPSERSKLLTATQNQLELFQNEQTSKYIAIVSTIKQVAPQINEDIKELKKINMRNMTISGRDYMYQLHSNFALYQQIAMAMDGLLDQSSTIDQLLKEYNAGKKEQEQLTRQDLMELKSKIANLISVTSEGVNLLEIMGQRTAYGILRKEGENSNNSEDIEEYLLNLTQNPTFSDNINWFELNFGAMDSSTSESLRVLSHIVNRALKKADVKVQNRTIELLELQNNLKSGESVLDLYEEDENGRTTGYLVRKLNYGRFYKDYDEELKRINSIISKKYNIILEDTNRTAPENNEQARREWNQMKNDWLATHCERKYVKEYYDIWNDVPQFARASLASINAEIASILQKPNLLDDKGHYHYDRLSDDEWNTFVNLTIQKKLLYSDYDRAGNLKEPGTVEYETAKALQNLNNKLNELRGGDENKKLKKDREAWLKALEEEKEACGGKEAYDKWKNGEDDHGFNVKRFKKWHERNSTYTFKTDEDGNAIVFKDMEQALHEIKVDYGEKYEDLKQKAKDLLKPYRAQNGEILAKEIPDAVQNLLQEIWREQYKIRKKVLKSNKALSQVAKKQSQVFKHFFEFKDTEYYKDIKRELRALAKDSSTGEFNQQIFESLLSNYGNFIYDYSSGIDVGFKPYRWLQKMVAIDKDKYMEYQPGWAWTEKSDNTDILNPKFVDAENTSMIPKKELYDNSKQWNKIQNSDSLKALYNKVHETMHESNEMQTNRQFADDFLLPQMTGTVWKRMKRHPFFKKLDILAQYFAESLGLGSKTNYKLNTAKVSSIGAGLGIASGLIVGSPLFAAFTGVVGLGLGLTAAGIFSSDAISANDYSSVGSNQALDNNNPEVKKNISSTPIKGQYPDGRSFHILPQYYTRRLENPTQISSDLVNIITNYYKMSCYYDEKVRIKDDCETLVDFIRSQKSKSSTQYSDNNADKSAVQNKENNTSKAAEKFLEMNLYDMKRTRVVKNIGPIELQWSKTASLWKNWTTRRNLGLNPKVALTGFLTTMGVHLLQSITGQQYGFLTGLTSWFEVLGRIGKNLCGARYIGNYLSKDKLTLCAEWYNVASQFERKHEGTNRNRLLNIIDRHSVFGMLSSIDFISKAIIMVSILKDHHLVDGEFVSKDDIRLNRYQYSKEEFKSKIKQWEKGESLYSVIKGGDTKIKVDEKYKEAFEKSDFKIKDRVQKLTEYADGMATDLQRASITQSIIGSFILIHRQYLPLIVQRYFGKMVYDYDTEQMKNGVFRTLFNYVGEVMKNNLALGIGAGAFTGGAFAGPLGVFLGVTSAVGFRAYGAYQHRNGIESKSMKQINKEMFGDFSNKKSTRTSYQNRYNMIEVVSTVLLYNIIVAPLASLVCSIADNDDDKRWWLQMLAFAARAFQWEFYTAFRTDDLLNNIKSPTAATSVLDAVEQFGNGLTTSATKILPVTTNTLFPQSNFLFDPSQAWDDATNIIGGESRKIKKGSYKDWEPWQRNVVKMSPVHNLIEQVKDSKSKRNYIENQVMHLPKDE